MFLISRFDLEEAVEITESSCNTRKDNKQTYLRSHFILCKRFKVAFCLLHFCMSVDIVTPTIILLEFLYRDTVGLHISSWPCGVVNDFVGNCQYNC